MTDTPPELEIETTGESLRERFSLVWLVPFLAMVISLGLAWQNYSSRGPLIEITFPDAENVRAGETEIRYRNVTIGVVDKVTFSADLRNVIVRARLDSEFAEYADDDATFWIVSPEVSTRGITGLETVLSGVFIEASWDADPEGTRYFFEGAESGPLIRPGQEGLLITLRTDAGEGLSNGTPILYRGIEVGRLANVRLGDDGLSSLAEAFIEAPYDRLVNSSTRFWDTSGFTFSIGPDGADIDFQSVAALLAGGITFDTIVSGGEPVANETTFRLYLDETTARGSIFADPETQARVQVSMVFEDSASGLAVGSPVQLSGITVGEVTGLTGLVDEDTFGDNRMRLLVTAALRPSRFGIGDVLTEEQFLVFLSEQVESGVRARLTSASILTGGLKIELAQLDDAEPDVLDRGAIPFPVFPTGSSNIEDVAATAEGVFRRINELRIEEVLDSAINLMNSGTRVLTSEGITELPDEVRGLVTDARELIGAEEIQALPGQISETATSLQAAVNDLQAILTAFEAEDGVTRLLAAVDAVTTTANGLTASAEALPALIDETTKAAAAVSGLDLAGLIENANGLVASADAFVASEDFNALPGQLASALAEVETALAELRADDGMARIVTAIQGVGAAAASVSGAVDTLNPALEGLPALSAELTELASTASDLELDDLVAQAEAALASITALTSSEDVAALPASLRSAVDELNASLTTFRTEEGMIKLIAAIEAAGAAADQVAGATEDLPALIENLTAFSVSIRELPADELAAQADAFLTSLNALISTDDAMELPAAMNDALLQVTNVLGELREGGTVTNVNAALASASDAAQSIEVAADQLPALMARLNAVLAQSQSTVASFGEDSQVNRELRAALRQVQEAAEALESLARAIERRPDSLLRGR